MKRVSIYRVHMSKVGSFLVEDTTVSTPETAYDVAQSFLTREYNECIPDRELFGVMWLNTKNKITGIEIVSIGTLDASLVNVRETFKGAILHNAASMIAFHNHPSGNPTPSREDIDTSKRLVKAGELLGIEILDHIVIGERRYASLKEEGLL